MKTVTTTFAPAPAGHYSQAIVHGGVVHVAGQLGLDPATREVVSGGIESQTERVLRNVEAILIAAGTDLRHTLSVTLYVTDRQLWPAVNKVFADVFGEHRPARAVIPVRELREGCLIEVQAVAALPDAQ